MVEMSANTIQKARAGAIRALRSSSHPAYSSLSAGLLSSAVSVAAQHLRTFLTLPQHPPPLARFGAPERAPAAVGGASRYGLTASAARHRSDGVPSRQQRLRGILTVFSRAGEVEGRRGPRERGGGLPARR